MVATEPVYLTTFLRVWTSAVAIGVTRSHPHSARSPHTGEASEKMHTGQCHFLTEVPQQCPTVLGLILSFWRLLLLTFPSVPFALAL